ncbi:MAG: hypothetical protein L6R35_004306 [Caloplaca aegaea]|nr:MAG: hypothetical protein L6R35_004306 [Caloplaca aegaea]
MVDVSNHANVPQKLYLDDSVDGDKTLLLALGADAVIPDPEAPQPVARRTQSTAPPWQKRLVDLIGMDQFGLLAAGGEKLLVLCLPKADTNGEVQAHGSELDGAGPGAIHDVNGHVHDAEDVDDQKREQHEPNLSHLDDRVVTLEPQIDACRVQEKGVDCCERNIGYASSIVVLRSSIVEVSRIEVHYIGVSRILRDDRRLVGLLKAC